MFCQFLKTIGNATSPQPKNKTGKKVIAQKIEIAQKTNVLSLTEHGLEEIPDQVFHCESLRTLDLSRNKLTKLGKISQLKELKSFNCDENALTSHELTPLSNLTKLQSLSLGRNRLENPSNRPFPVLPNTIKILKIHGNSLSSIPKQMCDQSMKLLEKLDLSFNNLAAVPAEICNLGRYIECQLMVSYDFSSILQIVRCESVTNRVKFGQQRDCFPPERSGPTSKTQDTLSPKQLHSSQIHQFFVNQSTADTCISV
ncbi:hypothetical protein ACHAWX_001448 [Stephanocyclus meneghinianus]